MPVKPRRSRTKRFHRGHVAYLTFGRDFFSDFPDGVPDDDELESAWWTLRDEVLELWRRRPRGHDFPWGYRRFELGIRDD